MNKYIKVIWSHIKAIYWYTEVIWRWCLLLFTGLVIVGTLWCLAIVLFGAKEDAGVAGMVLGMACGPGLFIVIIWILYWIYFPALEKTEIGCERRIYEMASRGICGTNSRGETTARRIWRRR